MVEPGGGGSGDRPCASHRPEPSGDGHPSHRAGDDRGGGDGAPRGQAPPGRVDPRGLGRERKALDRRVSARSSVRAGVRWSRTDPRAGALRTRRWAGRRALAMLSRCERTSSSRASQGSKGLVAAYLVLALAPRAKDQWLRRAVDDPELALGGELLRAFRAEAERASKLVERRTGAQLIAAAETHRGRRERAESGREERASRAVEAALTRRLAALAKRVDEAWTKLEALVAKSAYEGSGRAHGRARRVRRKKASSAPSWTLRVRASTPKSLAMSSIRR